MTVALSVIQGGDTEQGWWEEVLGMPPQIFCEWLPLTLAAELLEMGVGVGSQVPPGSV